MKPTEKSPEIDKVLGLIAGAPFAKVHQHRIASINNKLCAMCKGDCSTFKDEISRIEYTISGLCQKCQDSIFDEDNYEL